MASRLAWLDYSDHERRKALEVIDLFREEDTRDELGIGSVRDAFADLLFPGTSTLQTRARYFLFIPWIYLQLEHDRIAPAEVDTRLRRDEGRLRNSLENSHDTKGIIGKVSRDKLKRLPSSVYWAGLNTWGLRLFHGSQEQYHRLVCSGRRLGSARARRDDGDLMDQLRGANWNTNLPPKPKTFPAKTTFDLTKEEAAYLTDRVTHNATNTMLAHLLNHGKPAMCDYIWDHPQLPGSPTAVREQIDHAKHFSLVMHGAALLYNLMLAKKINQNDWFSKYQTRLGDWWVSLEQSEHELSEWNLPRFWEIARNGNPRVPTRTQLFINHWVNLTLNAKRLSDISKSQKSQQLISEREHHLKHNRARLHNRSALENWKGQTGSARIDYRWSSARTIINDILQALSQ